MKYVFYIINIILVVLPTLMKAQTEGERFRVYSQKNIVLDVPAEEVDSVAIVSKRMLRIYNAQKELLLSKTVSTIDSIRIGLPPMEPDLCNIHFAADASAKNTLNNNLPVTNIAGNTLTSMACPTCNENIIKLCREPNRTTAEGYYKMDFSENTTFQNKLQKGFTIECTLSADTLTTEDMYAIGTSQNGGFGILVNKNKQLVFRVCSLNNDSIWTDCASTTNIEKGKKYHVVAYYNGETHLAKLYVNGKQQAEVQLEGNLALPCNTACQWIALGGNATWSENIEQPWKGTISGVRMYTQIPVQKNVDNMYKLALHAQDDFMQPTLIQDIKLPTLYNVDKTYAIYGKGWQAGDKIKLTRIEDGTTEEYPVNIKGNIAKITIGSAFENSALENNICRVDVVRNGETSTIGQVALHSEGDGTFHCNLRQRITDADIYLPQGFSSSTVQGFDLDTMGIPFISYETTQGMRVTKWDEARKKGSLANDIVLPYSGHGDGFCMEQDKTGTYMWTSGSLGDNGSYSGAAASSTDTRLICRFKYVPGRIIYPEEAECFYLNSNGSRVTSIDKEHDQMLLWTTFDGSTEYMYIYRLSEAMNAETIELPLERSNRKASSVKAHNLNTITPISSFRFYRHGACGTNVTGGKMAIQGLSLYGNRIYVEAGIKTSIYATISVLDLKGNYIQQRAPAGYSVDKNMIQQLNLTADGTFEPEGIQIHKGRMYQLFVGDYLQDTGNIKHSCILELK